MAQKKTSRKELLKGPDEFLSFSSRAVNAISIHQRKLKIAGLAAVGVLAVYLGVQYWLGYVDRKGQTLYNEAYALLSENGPVKPGSESLETSKRLLSRVVDEYSLADAARLSLPQLGRIEFIQENTGASIRYFEKFQAQVSGDSAYDALARLAIASCHEMQGDLEKGIGALEPLLTQEDNPFGELAMLTLARLYRLNRQPEKEQEILQQFADTYTDSPFLPMVKAFLS